MKLKICERCGEQAKIVFPFRSGTYAAMIFPNGVCFDCMTIIHPELEAKLELKDGRTDDSAGSGSVEVEQV